MRSKARTPTGRLRAPQIVVIGFVSVIAVGTLILRLPAAQSGPRHAVLDDLFMATSAICVTGLSTVDIHASFTPLGRFILLALVQIGGLGYMTLATLSMILIGRRISLRQRLDLREATDQPGLIGVRRFVLSIAGFSVAVEAIGTILLTALFLGDHRLWDSVGLAAGHAVMAFNNAGFPVVPGEVRHWQGAPLTLIVLALLAIAGGLGFNVLDELVHRHLLGQKQRLRWQVLVRIVLGATALLLGIGTCAFWCLERNNPATLGPLSPFDRWVNAFFLSTQTRTCGFENLDIQGLTRPSRLIGIALMVIGGGPGGTAGGIKITTVAVILAAVLAVAQDRREVALLNFQRRISDRLVRDALTITVLSLGLIATVSTIIMAVEPFDLLAVLFEVCSAFSNVGLSVGITPHLGTLSKVLLMFTMLVGRIGALAILSAVMPPPRRTHLRYTDEPLMLG